MKLVLSGIVAGSLLLFLWSTFVHADTTTAIHKINASPASYDSKVVTLRGVPKKPTRISAIDLTAYVLEDNTGEIIILTHSGLPEMHKTITVRARIDNLAIINGTGLGTTVTELQRYQ